MTSNSKHHAFCTLYEGDYHYGVAALLNSLIKAGFEGTFVIGWKDAPPPWQNALEHHDDGSLHVRSIRVIFEEVKTPWLLAHVKPRFILDIFDRLVSDATAVTYADPDIVLNAPWSFFESWMANGVAICEDCCFPTLSRHHYMRKCWAKFVQETLDAKTDDTVERYYNSGFVGATRARRRFIELWQRALEALPEVGVSLEKLKPGTRFDPFFGTDQDALNMAAMMQPDAISTLGPEGMGFTAGMAAMWHAVDSPKPWRRRYLWHLLTTGQHISMAHREFWIHAGGPVKVWSPWRLRIRRFDLLTAVVTSRFYHSA